MAYKFCSNCGNHLPFTNYPFAPQTCTECGRTQYHNSKPCAGGLIVRDGCVLLVKRAVEPFKDYWDLPGGFLEAGEHPRDGMFREVREETGLEVRVRELLGVYVDRYDNNGDEIFTLNHYYIVEPIGGALRAADDVNAFAWFALDALPDAIAFEHAPVVLRDLQERMKRGF
ncbi:MAG: NUDIX domain-containing protein [Chloroflexi bacterium]|nr:NUDIX domain-containing protein [Chloroflexota bacterium]